MLSLSSWSLPSVFLAFTCTKREYCLCIQFHKPQKLFHMSPPYLPICGIYLPFQVNLYVPNSKPSNKNYVLYAQIAHLSTRAVYIFHARWVILTMSGLRSSFTRKWLVIGCPVPCSNQIKIIANKTPPRLLLVGRYPLFQTSRGICSFVMGSINFTILFGNRL